METSSIKLSQEVYRSDAEKMVNWLSDNEIVSNLNETIDKAILSNIARVDYTTIGDYDVIQVYIKKGTKAKDLGIILTNIEDYAKSIVSNVLVDFLRG